MPYQPLILLVCSGNICRSPVAEYLLRRIIHDAGDAERLRVSSAGTWCESGMPMASQMLLLLQQEGIDGSAHGSRLLTQEMIDEAELILVMTEGHRQDLRARFVRTDRKTFLLSEMVGKRYSIADPYGGEPEDYLAAKELIEEVLERGYPRIRELALHERRLPERRSLWSRLFGTRR